MFSHRHFVLSLVALAALASPPLRARTTDDPPIAPDALDTAVLETSERPPAVSHFAPGQDPSERAPSGPAWYDGTVSYSIISNCATGAFEYGMGTYVGFYANPDAGLPAPAGVYYLHVVIGGLGNSCAGQRARIDIQLPASTSLAISVPNPVACYYDGTAIPDVECPQSLPLSSLNPGAYWIPSVDSAHANTWPMPQGHILEVQVPVVSSTTLSNSPFQAHVFALDGNSNPWLRPAVGVYVFGSTPTILYPTPSTEITTSPSVGYTSYAYLYSHGITGNAYFDLGLDTSYGLFTDGPAVIGSASAYLVWSDWTPYALSADTTYHWRLRFAGSDGYTYFGGDQTFHTLPNGEVVVGNGSGASCNTAALDAALSSPGVEQVTFDCGLSPITIAMSGTRNVAGTLTVNGGSRVTLDGQDGIRPFVVQNGGVLTLADITITGGFTIGCGGAVRVQNGGSLFMTSAILTGSTSIGDGGALCIDWGGYVFGDFSMISGNSATEGGGGIYNEGMAEFVWSEIDSNSAGANGGGVYNNGSLYFSRGLISGNLSPALSTSHGGGLYNIGDASISTSTLSGNTASWGGGIANDGASLYLTGVTIAANTAEAFGKPGAFAGGGIESTITANLRNTILADNSPNNCSDSAIYRFVTSLGYSLDSGTNCGLAGPGDLVGVDPWLGALADNGGPTRTHALLMGSPAIDAGDNIYCGFYDQRGFSGPDIGGVVARQMDGDGDGVAVCDIGAYEYEFKLAFLPMVLR